MNMSHLCVYKVLYIKSVFIFFLKFFVEVQLIYNVLVSGVQQKNYFLSIFKKYTTFFLSKKKLFLFFFKEEKKPTIQIQF